ncbi:MAG: DMT family transporter [Anaerovoracaceae bacterium]|jgi:drug/metabolite transporter (DMT)-like permease
MAEKKMLQKTAVVWILAMVCCALWGSAFPCIKTGYRLFSIASQDPASQILFAGIRFFFAGILALIFASLQAKKPVVPGGSSLLRILILALFQTILQYIFFYVGLAHISAVKGSIIQGTSTFFAILLAVLVFRQERFSLLKTVGCVLGFIGLVIVNLGGGESLSLSFHPLGEGCMLLASISSALSTVFLKVFSQKDNPVMLSGSQFVLGGAVMIAVGAAGGGHLVYSGPSCIILMIYMALISSVAYSLWGVLLKYNPVSRITVFGFMTQIFGVFLSAVVLSDYSNIHLFTMAALALVCMGIYLVNRPQ